MLEFFQNIDTQLFLFFNATLANPVFDWLMPFITKKQTWYPVWAVLIVGLVWKGGPKGRWVIVMAIFVVTVTDQTAASLMKPFFERVRPCNVVEGAHMLVNKKSSWSMPSAHAANFFGVAMLFSYFYRKYQWICWTCAVLVGYSRIAIGVHYPFDVLVGALVGVAGSLLVIGIFQYFYHMKTGTYLK